MRGAEPQPSTHFMTHLPPQPVTAQYVTPSNRTPPEPRKTCRDLQNERCTLAQPARPLSAEPQQRHGRQTSAAGGSNATQPRGAMRPASATALQSPSLCSQAELAEQAYEAGNTIARRHPTSPPPASQPPLQATPPTSARHCSAILRNTGCGKSRSSTCKDGAQRGSKLWCVANTTAGCQLLQATTSQVLLRVMPHL